MSAASTSSIDGERFVRKPVFQLRDLSPSTPLVSLSRNPDSPPSRQPVTATTGDSLISLFAFVGAGAALVAVTVTSLAGSSDVSGRRSLTASTGAGFLGTAGSGNGFTTTVGAGGFVLMAATAVVALDGRIFFASETAGAGMVSSCACVTCGSAITASRGRCRAARNPPVAMMPLTARTIVAVLAIVGEGVAFFGRPLCDRVGWG